LLKPRTLGRIACGWSNGLYCYLNQNICIVNKNWMRHLLLSKVNRHHNFRDKSLLRAERRSCNSNFRLIQVYLRVNVSKNQRKIKKSRTWSKISFVPFFFYRYQAKLVAYCMKR